MNRHHQGETGGASEQQPWRPDSSRGSGNGISRRVALQRGLAGAAGMCLAAQARRAAQASTPPAKAKAVIQIWMWGGPCHLDTFDPKPQAGNDYTGSLNRPIETNVSGIRICQLLPLLAKQADKYSIIRSMTHGVNGHETASYMVQTGRESGGKLVYPSVGAVVSKFKGYDAGYEGLIPPYIVVTRPQGRFSEAGFLGSRYKPFATGGDPRQPRFIVEGVVAPGISDERQHNRRNLLNNVNTLAQLIKNTPEVKSAFKCEEQAYDLILGDAGKVFDLNQEKSELRDQYGMTTFGQSCLLARRLVEKGVRFITINYGGWDTHKQHFQSMRRMLPDLDKGMATLLADLSDRGLLDSTIVWWGGEFGRTPRVLWNPPWNGGRSHYGSVFSMVVAGGGFRGGTVVGSSDAKAEQVKDRPVYPVDLISSMYQLVGIDPEATVPYQGNDIRITPTAEEGIKSAGMLKEIT